MSDVNERCAKVLGWRAFLQRRGGYTHFYYLKPGEREPWLKQQDSEKAKASYTEVALSDRDPHDHVPDNKLPDFEHDVAACFRWLVPHLLLTYNMELYDLGGGSQFACKLSSRHAVPTTIEGKVVKLIHGEYGHGTAAAEAITAAFLAAFEEPRP